MQKYNPVEILEPRIAPAAVFTWRGAGVDPLWTNPDNWQGHVVPEPGSALVFKHTLSARNPPYGYNNFPDGTVFESITFRSDSPHRADVTLAGNSVELLDGIRGLSSARIRIGIDIKLGADQTFAGSYHPGHKHAYGATLDLNGYRLTLESQSADARNVFYIGRITDTSGGGGGSVLNLGPASLYIGDGSDLFRIINKSGDLFVGKNPGATVNLEGGTLRKGFQISELVASGAIVEGGYRRTVGGDLRMAASSTFVAVADRDADEGMLGQFRVEGRVVLNQPSLHLFVPHHLLYGTETVIIENDGDDAVIGHFEDLPQGGLILKRDPRPGTFDETLVNSLFRITYTGGDGNDVAVIAATPQASISGDGRLATYTDVDGDLVTMTLERHRFTEDGIVLSAPNEIGGQELLSLKLQPTPFGGLDNLSITAEQRQNGDGRVNVGAIGVKRMGTISVEGDLAGLGAYSIDALVADSLGKEIAIGPHHRNYPAISVGYLRDAEIHGDVATDVAFGEVERFEVDGSLTGSLTVESAQSIRIHGDVWGGRDAGSGSIRLVEYPYSSIHLIKIDGSLIGGSGEDSGSIVARLGYDPRHPAPNGSIDKIEIGGSIYGAQGDHVGFAGSIRAGDRIGKIEIHGSILGTEGHPVVIGANGGLFAKNHNPALGAVYIDGDVRYVSFTAGGAFGRSGVASINGIFVQGDWIASNAVAGVKRGEDHLIGTADDHSAGLDESADLTAQIGAIIIYGNAYGTEKHGDSFGIVAEQIGFVHIGGQTFAMNSSPESKEDFIYVDTGESGPNGARSDFTIHEVPLQRGHGF